MASHYNSSTPFLMIGENGLRHLRHLTLLIACAMLMACTALPNNQSTSVVEANKAGHDVSTDVEMIAPKSKPLNRPFSEQGLYNLLMAEFAITNQHVPLALEKYMQEAHSSNDAGVAERATRIALFARDHEAAISAAELWYELEPGSNNAAALYAELLARAGKPASALDILELQLQQGDASNFSILSAARFPNGPNAETNANGVTQITQRLQSLNQQYPNQPELLHNLARLLQNQQRFEEALDAIEQAARLYPNSLTTIALEVQLLENLQRHEDAANRLQDNIDEHPDNRRLQLLMARLLTSFDLPKAEIAFEKLLVDTPDDFELIYSHAAIAYENNNLQAAKASLEKLLTLNRKADSAHYYLGLIAENENQDQKALSHYEQIGQGQYLLSASQQASYLLYANGREHEALALLASHRQRYPEQARQLYILEAGLLRDNGQLKAAKATLDTALEQFPSHIPTRLERSLVSESLNQIDAAIADLEFILAQEPDNAIALNALGYTLADRTERYDEALTLIQQAITLRPDDGAIIDSLGWVQYKMGDFKLAIENLEKAYAIFPDDEVAAHLIEAYWQDGQKRKARKIIRAMQKSAAPTPKVDATIERLAIR